ncbi:MAG: hypothetical protein GWN47_10340, partial [Woeseiaceae bacterium]|nr:hypothetical protein [Woeseiaceae bacterium]
EMSNHVKKFYTAVSVLAGHGHIKQRLIKAFEDNLAHIEDDTMPSALRESFLDLNHLMNQVEPLNGEGPICASVRKMSIDEADQCAQRILDLYSDMVRVSLDAGQPIPLKVEDRQVATPVLVNTN